MAPQGRYLFERTAIVDTSGPFAALSLYDHNVSASTSIEVGLALSALAWAATRFADMASAKRAKNLQDAPRRDQNGEGLTKQNYLVQLKREERKEERAGFLEILVTDQKVKRSEAKAAVPQGHRMATSSELTSRFCCDTKLREILRPGTFVWATEGCTVTASLYLPQLPTDASTLAKVAYVKTA